MFFKKTIRTNWTTKKKYHTYSLVESIKWKKYYQHKFIVSAWNLDDFTTQEIKQLEQKLTQEITWSTQNTLFEEPINTKVAEKYNEITKNYYQKVKTEEQTKINKEKNSNLKQTWKFIEINPQLTTQSDVKYIWNEMICNNIYEELQIDAILKDCDFTKRQTEILKMLILWRTINPTSERGTIRWSQNMSWLWELTWANYNKLSHKTVYSLLKKLEKNQEAIEKHLENKESEIFPDDTIILYDLTNVYFEWKWILNNYAQYWRSKERRSDCLLMWIWLIINQNGFVKTSKVFKWNESEPFTFETMIDDMEKKKKNLNNNLNDTESIPTLPFRKPTVIIDAWIATEKNITLLKEKNYTYVVVKRWTKVDWTQLWDYKLTKSFFNDNWTLINEISIRRNQQDEEIFLECKSKKKNQKEQSIMLKLETLLESKLKSLSESIENWKICDESKIYKKIWTIQWKYSRISQYYNIELNKIEWWTNEEKSINIKNDKNTEQTKAKTNKKNIKYSLSWWINKEKKEKYTTNREKYILRSNLCNCTDEEVWDIYNMIRRVEDSFRTLKTDLRIRPIYHQTKENSIAHIFLSVLAYHIVNIVLYRLKEKWINIRWSTFLEDMWTQILSTIKHTTVTWGHIKVRTISEPTEIQKKYYDILKINASNYKSKKLTYTKN